jgi:hypothetical protein
MSIRQRIKGKIATSEWPSILQRHQAGEAIAAIARSYQCTPPAIRYILRRRTAGAAGAPAVTETPRPENGRREPGFSRTLIERVNGDVAAFLVAFETTRTAFNARNARELRRAADRLLQCSAHTRIELDHLSGLLAGPESPARALDL